MLATNDIILVSVTYDIDVTTLARLRHRLDELIEQGYKRIILDMSSVQYIDSAGFALIVQQFHKLQKHGGLLSLVNLSDRLYRTFCLAHLIDFIPATRMCDAHTQELPLDPKTPQLFHLTKSVSKDSLVLSRAFVEQALAGMPFSKNEVFDIVLAAGEALGNAIDHTCAQGVLLSITGYADRLIIEVSDCGCGCDEKAASLEAKKQRATLERGRGLALMRMLVDGVEMRYKSSGTGTVVRLTKLIHKK